MVSISSAKSRLSALTSWKPFGEAPGDDSFYWHNPPSERGTYRILSTCMITLFLCVYTSLHLDISENTKARWFHQLLRKSWWGFLGLAAPEYIAFMAIQNWILARNLKDDMDLILGKKEPDVSPADLENGSNPGPIGLGNPSTMSGIPLQGQHTTTPAQGPASPNPRPEREHPWTSTHSYFALMGGFAIDTEGMSISPLMKGQERGIMRAPAVQLIAANVPEVLPDITQEEIQDKSNANGLTKILVCLQAFWFCAQILGRLSTKNNPISLLELNTFLHALCCLGTYGAWWKKPLDISVPALIKVSKQEHWDFYARICVGHPLHCKTVVTEEVPKPKKGYTATLALKKDIIQAESPQARTPELATLTSGDATEDVDTRIQDSHHEAQDIELRNDQVIHGYQLKIKPNPTTKKVYVKLKQADIECLKRVKELSGKSTNREFQHKTDKSKTLRDQEEMEEMKNTEKIKEMRNLWKSPEQLLLLFRKPSMFKAPCEKLKCLKKDFDKKAAFAKDPRPINLKFWSKHFDLGLYISVMAAGAVYGGVHLLAWDGPFDNNKHRWLWRISCMIIASPILVIPLFVLVLFSEKHFLLNRSQKKWDVKMANIFIATGYVLVFSAARVYLVVECFWNLFRLPRAVYNEPSWSQFIPHLGAG